LSIHVLYSHAVLGEQSTVVVVPFSPLVVAVMPLLPFLAITLGVSPGMLTRTRPQGPGQGQGHDPKDKDKDLLDLTHQGQGQGQGPDSQGPGQRQGLEKCP